MTMRRKDREVQDRAQIDEIIRDSEVCRLALAVEDSPYLVPLSFGYDGTAIYLHTAAEGKKIAYFQANPRVCFELEHGVRTVRDDKSACNWSVAYESVIGYGTIHELVEPGQKEYALQQIMRHYSGEDWTFEDGLVRQVRAWKITIESMTAKRSKRDPIA